MAQSPAIPAPCIMTHLERTSIHETGLSETHLMVTHRIVSNQHIIVCLFGRMGFEVQRWKHMQTTDIMHHTPGRSQEKGHLELRMVNLWEKHGFVGWQCSLSSHVSCADGPAQKNREDTRFGRITWAQNKMGNHKSNVKIYMWMWQPAWLFQKMLVQN
jgi:hypothetical protein